MPLTNKTLQQVISQVFFPKAKGKKVFVWGDVDTSQRSVLDSGTVCYVSIDTMSNFTLPRFDNGVYRKDCQAIVALRFAGVDAFTYAEQAQFLLFNRKAQELFRDEGCEILGATSTSAEPFLFGDNNIATSANVRIKLNYTMVIDPSQSKLNHAIIDGGIKVETPSR